MGWTSVGLFLVLAALAATWVAHIYRRRELRVPGVAPLAVLRILALVVVLLLLLDPSLPAAATGLGGARAWTLVDGSRSMAAPTGDDSPWREALDLAAGGGGPVLVFGGEPRLLDDLADLQRPPYTASRLVPALERAAESGARRVRVVSDLRVEDGARARALAERLGLQVTVEPLGGDVRSAGVEAFRLDGPLEGDEPVRAEVTVFVVGTAPGDSLTLEVREEERLVGTRRLATPDEGRVSRVELELPEPEGEGEVRYTASVTLDGDAFPDDDARVAWADVNPEEGNLVLVALEADWEPRFLLPVLERVTGLPVRGYVAVGPERFLAMDAAGAGGTVELAAVQAMAAGAEILVVQAGSVPPGWLADALQRVRRGVVLARAPAAAVAAGVQVGAARPGEWYAALDVPPSPLAGELAGVDFTGLPPLGGLLPVAQGEAPGPVPLRLQLQGSGLERPAMVLVSTSAGGRRAVALASGFWRWAFRPGAGRTAYERLWSGVAGWLLADEALAGGPGVRPEERAVPAGEPVWWRASGLAGEEVALRLARGDSVVRDTTVTVPEAGRFRLPPLDAGTWSWQARLTGGGAGTDPPTDSGAAPPPAAVAGPAPGTAWSGRLDAESWTADLRHPRDTLLAGAGAGGSGAGLRGPGRPLRTHPLPYLLVLALLSAEWVLRRRKGLR